MEADLTGNTGAGLAPEALLTLLADAALTPAAMGSTSFTVVSFFFPAPVDKFS